MLTRKNQAQKRVRTNGEISRFFLLLTVDPVFFVSLYERERAVYFDCPIYLGGVAGNAFIILSESSLLIRRDVCNNICSLKLLHGFPCFIYFGNRQGGGEETWIEDSSFHRNNIIKHMHEKRMRTSFILTMLRWREWRRYEHILHKNGLSATTSKMAW